MLTEFNNIWEYFSCENLQPNDTFLSYSIQFVCAYYRIEKQKIYAFKAATLSCRSC